MIKQGDNTMEKTKTNENINLTKREKEVLSLLVEGYDNIKISNELNCTIHTTKAHIHSILYKMNAKTRLIAAIKAVKSNIIS